MVETEGEGTRITFRTVGHVGLMTTTGLTTKETPGVCLHSGTVLLLSCLR